VHNHELFYSLSYGTCCSCHITFHVISSHGLVLLLLLFFWDSRCGLCDTYYIAHVKNACAFLGDGMSRIEVSLFLSSVAYISAMHKLGATLCFSLVKIFCLTKVAYCFPFQRLEPVVHGRGRKTDNMDETYLGVYEELLYARKLLPVEGIFSKLGTEDSFSFWCLCYLCILLSLVLSVLRVFEQKILSHNVIDLIIYSK